MKKMSLEILLNKYLEGQSGDDDIEVDLLLKEIKKFITIKKRMYEEKLLDKQTGGSSDDRILDLVIHLIKKFRDDSNSEEKLECILQILIVMLLYR